MNQSRNTFWWITSLAISVTCCSVLFVFFAMNFFQIKEDLAISRIRLESLDQRLDQMNFTLQLIEHTRDPQAAAMPGTRAGASAQMPTTAPAAPPVPAETKP